MISKQAIALLCGIFFTLHVQAQSVKSASGKPKPRLNHIAIQVSSLQKSTLFYIEILGLDTIPEPFHDGRHTWFDIGGGAHLHIIEAAYKPVIPLKQTHLCFSVASVPDFVEKLKQKNIAWEDWPGKAGAITTRVDGVHQIYFQDPDGYWLEINDDQETIVLFNGKNLDGWYAYEPASGKLKNASELFTVDHKMIRLYGNKAGYLMSGQSFKDFKLTVEFRWNTDSTFIRKTDKKNSGVMYLVPLDTPDTLWPKGIQFQIKEGATGDFVLLQEVTININGKKTEPGKSVAAARFADAEKAFGEWNTIVITCLHGKVKQELNGKLVNEGMEPTVREGRVLLQYEGYPIDFRQITVEKL